MCNNPWIDLPAVGPYWLPNDSLFLNNYNILHPARIDSQIVHHIIPEPFVGNLNPLSGKKPIIFLNLNPGYNGPEAHNPAMNDSNFRAAAIDNLNHNYPGFFLLEFPNYPGYLWWNRKLNQLINATSFDRVRNGIFCLEWFGYCSRSFDANYWAVNQIPSQEYAFCLLKYFISQDYLIIIMRSRSKWTASVPLLEGYQNLIELRNPQNPSISPGNMTPAQWQQLINAI